jgi:hypothetical protein
MDSQRTGDSNQPAASQRIAGEAYQRGVASVIPSIR